MPAPTASLNIRTIGTPATRVVSAAERDTDINAALSQLWGALLSGSTEEQIAEILVARDVVLGIAAALSGRTIVTHSGGNSTTVTLPFAASSVDVIVNGSFWPRSNYTHTGTSVVPLVPWPTGTNNVEIYARTALDAADLNFAALPPGSAASPALSFAMQPNLGLYRIGLSLLGFAADGAERMRVSPSGVNVTGDLTVGNSTVFRRANILGTVSQTAGVPTGAVIQRGSNATGNFVRFADGLQICTFTGLPLPVASATGSIFFSATTGLWSYPATFAATPVVVAHVPGSTSRWATASANVSQAGLRHFSGASSATELDTAALAIGRWFI
jgi:hypothetical protein